MSLLKRDISHFNILDWNFKKEDSRHFLHNFCWYPSRFIPIIPAHLIQALSKENEIILDPFCGIGTTVVEALKLKRNAIGIDINPIGAFIAETKAAIIIGKPVTLKKIIEFNDYLKYLLLEEKSGLLFTNTKKIPASHQIPNFKENDAWYHEETLKMLANIYDHIEKNFTGLTRDICRIFFISILMNSSGYRTEKTYAHYADNCKPKGEKAFKNSYKLYQQKLGKFILDYAEFKSEKSISENFFHIYNADSKNLDESVKNKVDLIVTSPPYLNVTDYTTAFRLAYLWYEIFAKKIQKTKQLEIGARWKRKQHTKLQDYMAEMEQVLAQMAACLKRNRYLCLIIGESKKYNEVVNNKIIELLTKKFNFELIDIFTRDINKKFFVHPEGGGVQKEEILIFRKNG